MSKHNMDFVDQISKLLEEKQRLVEEKEELKEKIEKLQSTNDRHLAEMQKIKKDIVSGPNSAKVQGKLDDFESIQEVLKKMAGSMPRIANRLGELDDGSTKLINFMKKRMEELISDATAKGATDAEQFQEICDEIADEVHENLQIIHGNFVQNKEALHELLVSLNKLCALTQQQATQMAAQAKTSSPSDLKALGIIQQEFNQCKAKLKETKAKFKSEQLKNSELTKELEELNEEKEGQEAEIEELQGAVAEREEVIKELRIAGSKLSEKMESLRAENKKLFDEKSELSLTVESLEERSIQLNKNISSLDEDSSLRMRDLQTKLIQEKLKNDSITRDSNQLSRMAVSWQELAYPWSH